MSDWRLLSNHGLVLVYVARDPGMTLRRIGDCVGVTERTALAIVNDLVDAGYLKRFRRGNRNNYEVLRDMPIRPPLGERTIGEIIDLFRENQEQDGDTDQATRTGARSETGER